MTDMQRLFEARKTTVFERVKDLLGRACVFPIEDDLALDEIEDACRTAEAEPDKEKRIQAVSRAISLSQNGSFLRRFAALNNVLVKHGRWISPTYLVHGEILKVESLCTDMEAKRRSGDGKGAEESRIAIMRIVASAALHPKTRAFMIARATRLPNLSDVAHYLDSAALQFYRQNYFGVANMLIPAIERLLVSISGWRLAHGGEIGTKEYRDVIVTATPLTVEPTLKARFEAHRDEILRFLFDRFFVRSGAANRTGLYDTSLINRAFAFHLNEPGSYYTFEDCVTYFQVFDLFVEFIAAQHGRELPGLIPNDDPGVAFREAEYWALILNDWLTDGQSPERRLLPRDPLYVQGADHNYLGLHEGADLNRLLVQAGLAIQALPGPNVPINSEKQALYVHMLANYTAMAPKKP